MEISLAQFLRIQLNEEWAECDQTQRVLADIDAKQQIIDMYESISHWSVAAGCPSDQRDWNRGQAGYLFDVLRLLSQPYSDHPAYRPEWKL